jgi:GT2 family glycosyltransferase
VTDAAAAPPLTIVLASYRRPDRLVAVLGEIARLRRPPAFDVVAVVQGYDEPMAATVAGALGPGIAVQTIEYPQPLGLIAARYVGVAHARGDVVAFIDDDIELPVDWPRVLLEPYADPSVGGVAGFVRHGPGFSTLASRLLRALGANPPVYRIDRFGYAFHPLTGFATSPAEAMWLPGGASSYRRRLFAELGPFEEAFRYGFEDVEFGARARRAGWTLRVVPAATIVHHPSPANRMSRREAVYHMERVRVLAVRKVLQDRSGWRRAHWCGFARMLLVHGLSAVANRDWRLPVMACKGALAGRREFGHAPAAP